MRAEPHTDAWRYTRVPEWLTCVCVPGTSLSVCCDALGKSYGGVRDHLCTDLLVDLPCLHYQGEDAECLCTDIGAGVCPDDVVSIPACFDSLVQVWTDGRGQTRVTPS